jgi:hypothetical protein
MADPSSSLETPLSKVSMPEVVKGHNTMNWGQYCFQCFLRFSPMFGRKFGAFLKKQCYDPIFGQIAAV